MGLFSFHALYQYWTLVVGFVVFAGVVAYRFSLGEAVTPAEVSKMMLVLVGYLVLYVARIEYRLISQKCPGEINVKGVKSKIEDMEKAVQSLENVNSQCYKSMYKLNSHIDENSLLMLDSEGELLRDGQNLCEQVKNRFCWFNVPLGRIYKESNFKKWLLPALARDKRVHFIVDKRWESFWPRIEELVHKYCPAALEKELLTVVFHDIDCSYAVKIADIGFDHSGKQMFQGQFWILDKPFTSVEIDRNSTEEVEIFIPKIVFSFSQNDKCSDLFLAKIQSYWDDFGE
ncbi:hypothetical protein [Maridesulfovibrio sp.]|uniref:hypothetical protein n=1 Tax=Maridesulfovibrio sp. TaxID=2795000 RepID=UPI0039F02057